jgi:hypothetical protein
MSTPDAAIIGLFCTILGVVISKIWFTASQFTSIQAAIAKTKQDVNTIGIQVKNNDRKANRRNQQMVAAQLDIHAENPTAVRRIAILLKDDSWE